MHKVSYKTYYNERLKQVYLNGLQTYPLYVQLTFERKTIFFKSYYFELFSKPRYTLSVAGLNKGPLPEEIIAKENELINFIIGKHPEDFSLKLFKQEYSYYCKDICDGLEEDFIDYLYTFFEDKGMPAFAAALREGSQLCVAYDLVKDMKGAFTPFIYNELITNSFFYAPPYLPLYGFMVKIKKWPMLSLSVMEWETANTQTAFGEYLQKQYPTGNFDQIKEQLEKWLHKTKVHSIQK